MTTPLEELRKLDWVSFEAYTRAQYNIRKAAGEFKVGWMVVFSGDTLVAHVKDERAAAKAMGKHPERCVKMEVGDEFRPIYID